MASTPPLYSCPYRRTHAWTRCTLLGLAPIFWMHVAFSSRTSNFALIDSDKFRSFGPSCAGHDPPADLLPELMPSSPIAPAQKRARSVDTATQQQPGPLSSCQNRAVLRTLRPSMCGHRLQMPRAFEDEVDFGGSEPPSPHPTEREEEKSGNSSPAAHSRSDSTDKR